MKRYKILSSKRGAVNCPPEGTVVYPAACDYGVAEDDTKATGVEHVALSINPNGVPFFTIPRVDVQEILSE